jgi:hypothetical protein
MAKESKPLKKASTPGPKPDRLKIKGSWQSAMRKSLTKRKPPEGWPK